MFRLCHEVSNPLVDSEELKIALGIRRKTQRPYMRPNMDLSPDYQLIFQAPHQSIFIPTSARCRFSVTTLGKKVTPSLEYQPKYDPDLEYNPDLEGCSRDAY